MKNINQNVYICIGWYVGLYQFILAEMIRVMAVYMLFQGVINADTN